MNTGNLRLLAAFFGGAAFTGAIGFALWPANSTRSAAPLVATVRQATARLGTEAAKPSEPHSHQAMAQQLRRGGYLIYIRHGNRQKWDSVIGFDVVEAALRDDASRQSWRDAVCLSEQGREEGRMIGRVFKMAAIPVGHVLSSPICRARETAMLAFGRIDSTHNALIHTPVVNDSNAAQFKAELARLLRTTPIAKGTNTVVSAHENTLRNHRDLFASGTELFDAMLQESGMHIIRRDADGTLHVVHRFANLGDLAAGGISLDALGRTDSVVPAGKPAN